MDAGGIDGIICTVDLMKQDSEIKIFIGCSEEEKRLILTLHNESEYMKGVLLLREKIDRQMGIVRSVRGWQAPYSFREN